MFRLLSLGAAIAAFLLAILGSWVRINGAGMTCPDWPLCHGALIPTLEGGVILEWSHRLVALLDGVLVVGALIAAWRERDRIAGVPTAIRFITVVFAAQVLLGAGTVHLNNSPPSVAAHWGTGMAFLAGLVALTLLAFLAPRPGTLTITADVPYRLALLLTVVFAFSTMCIGAYVSSSGAGLACSTIPDCEGSFWGVTPLQFAQMLHRVAAGGFFLAALIVTYWTMFTQSTRVRAIVLASFSLLVLQIMLGIANVAWSLPTVLREAHAANAAAVFVAFVASLVVAVVDGARVPSAPRVPAPSREAVGAR